MRRLTVLIAAVLLSVSGCGGQAGPVADKPGPTGTGKLADYRFTGTTLAGDVFDGTSLEGKPAVLWFWAPWCPTCHAQIATVSELAEKYDGEVAVVGVGGLDTKEAINNLAADIPHITHLVDAEGSIWRHFGVTEQSSYAVIDADGEILAQGYLDDQELVDLVNEVAG